MHVCNPDRSEKPSSAYAGPLVTCIAIGLISPSSPSCSARCDQRIHFEFGRECMLTSNMARQASNPPLDGFAVANILQA